MSRVYERRAEGELWHLYTEQRDENARGELIARYGRLAQRLAAMLYAQRPDDSVPFEDYLQFGMVGLLESVGRYRTGSEASFETYATYRIRGSILNGIEKATEQREQSACRARARRERIRSLNAAAGGENRDDPLMRLFDVAMGLALGFILEDTGMFRSAAEAGEDDVEKSSEIADIASRLNQVVAGLPSREQDIIKRHYYHHETFDSIAASLRLTKGRVSQLHTRALSTVRSELARRYSLDSYY